jgi:transcription-repair coupling factor (superfamily II helicase)
VRLDVDVDAYVPGRLRRLRAGEDRPAPAHRRAREVADVELLREELEDRFGPVPEPVENLLALQRARIKLGAGRARAVSFRGGRLAVAPIELDSAGVRALRERLPEAIYESGRSQVSVRVAEEAQARFADIVAAADASAGGERRARVR